MRTYFVLYSTFWLQSGLMTSRRWKSALLIILFKNLWFFIIPVCTPIKSVRKTVHNQMIFTSSNKCISFSKYLRFHLVVSLTHANWANPIKEIIHPSLCRGLTQRVPVHRLSGGFRENIRSTDVHGPVKGRPRLVGKPTQRLNPELVPDTEPGTRLNNQSAIVN